jgi:hypothetical protein
MSKKKANQVIKSSIVNIERVVIKLPKSLADYLRKEFPHGKRSEFLAKCIARHEHEKKVAATEEELRQVAKKRSAK